MFATWPVLQSSAQQAPPAGAKVAPLPDPKPGSWWVYKDAKGEWKEELKKVDGGKFIVQQEGVDREVVYTNEWNQIEGPAAATAPDWLSYSPHFYSYSFPLWQGKKWTGQYTIPKYPGQRNVWGEAKRWETVKVPAGTLEALKVETERQVFTATGRFLIKTTCWYAVEVQREVKCEGTINTRELVRYELK